jgi:polysaccharide pyruvyl transferase CsaB
VDRRPRIFLVGYYGTANLGDEAIREAIEAAARALDVEVANFAVRGPGRGDPREVRSSPGSWRAYVAAIRRADRVVIGGGGVLKDEGLRLPVDLLATALLARLLRRRVTLLAVGVGPFYSRIGRWLIAAVARLARVRTVRDEASAVALRGLGVGGVEVGADPVLAMTAPRPAGGSDRPAGRRAIVGLRPWFLKDPEPEARRAAFRRAVADGLRPLIDAGWELELAALYWSRDRDEAAALARLLGAGASVSIPEAPSDWEALVASTAGADLVIAMRYHCVAAGVAAGRPVLALAYEPKVRSLATELGLGRLDVDDPDLAPRLRDALSAWLGGGDAGAGATTAPASARAEAYAAVRDRGRRALERALTG